MLMMKTRRNRWIVLMSKPWIKRKMRVVLNDQMCGIILHLIRVLKNQHVIIVRSLLRLVQKQMVRVIYGLI
ncbi:hypothetical protein HanXRQr2_Chr13g0571771 [Helianthus annuus]|uniref:Uncharacterized protein n=1 Tax=Helianthus annuus TaxID=4232 RepID=A0A251T710_HELAN|nr:hypothetical protein HanXRQr2_Chr13g0571771 [Helianthus annuus]KAJ0847875.1 hypothetical protein HanPSC8_Chr13g0550451 [Helianthus annuus]